MTEQRLKTLEHLRAGMTPGRVRILPREMEQGIKEFASGVEQLVDRLVGPLFPALQCSFKTVDTTVRSLDRHLGSSGISALAWGTLSIWQGGSQLYSYGEAAVLLRSMASLGRRWRSTQTSS